MLEDPIPWLREPDLNRRPSGYEPDELPLLHPATFFEALCIYRYSRAKPRSSNFINGGQGWVRTIVPLGTDLQSVAFNHSATCPLKFKNFAITHSSALFGDPYGIRTRVTAVKGRCLRPLDQRAIFNTRYIYMRATNKFSYLIPLFNVNQ